MPVVCKYTWGPNILEYTNRVSVVTMDIQNVHVHVYLIVWERYKCKSRSEKNMIANANRRFSPSGELTSPYILILTNFCRNIIGLKWSRGSHVYSRHGQYLVVVTSPFSFKTKMILNNKTTDDKIINKCLFFLKYYNWPVTSVSLSLNVGSMTRPMQHSKSPNTVL